MTRVSSEDNQDLGSDIAAQLVTEPKAMLITSAILAIFAVIPGFPTTVFATLSALCAGGGWYIMKKRQNSASHVRSNEMPSLAPALAPKGVVPSFQGRSWKRGVRLSR